MIKDRLRAIKEGLKGIKSIKRLRLSLNGFSNLKRSHNLSLWRNTKTLLLELFPLPPNCRYSKHIFQHSFPSAEMVIHQYVSDLTLKLWFGNRLLIAYSRESKKVSWPLPKIWVNQLINQNIPVNCLLSRIYFGFLVIGVFFLNLIQSFF